MALGELRSKVETTESGEPEEKRRIHCDYPGMLPSHTFGALLIRGALDCKKSFLRYVASLKS
jgi:hypothetical protein